MLSAPATNPYANAGFVDGMSSGQAPNGQAYGFSTLSASSSPGVLPPSHTGSLLNNQNNPAPPSDRRSSVSAPWHATSLGQGIGQQSSLQQGMDMHQVPQHQQQHMHQGIPQHQNVQSFDRHQLPGMQQRQFEQQGSLHQQMPQQGLPQHQQFHQAAPQHQFQNQGAPQQQFMPQQQQQLGMQQQHQQGMQQQYMQAAPPQQSGSSHTAAASGASDCVAIAALSPYTNGRWRIKARVTMKSDIRKFTNARGEGQFFKIELVDKDGGEITGTFFGKAAGDRYFNFLQQHQVYYFGKGSIKPGNKRFDKSEYVITFDENTIIEPAEPDEAIPGVRYAFTPLADIERLDIGTTIDIKAIIQEVRDPFTVTIRKTNEEKVKRDIVLWDESGPEGSFIEICIWGQRAHDNWEAGAVIYGKDFRVSEWQGVKSLNVGQYELNPDHPQAFELKRRFEEKRPSYAGGPARKMLATAQQETIQQCQMADMNLPPPSAPGQAQDPKSVARHYVMATFASLSADKAPYYAACPELVDSGRQPQGNEPPPKRQCNKKVSLEGQFWTCASGHTCQRPVHRYLFQRQQISDHTGSLDISFFDEVGKQVLGCDAEELAAAWEDPEREAQVQQHLIKASYKRYSFRLKSQREVWQEETRTKVSAESVSAPDYVKEGNRMLEEIKAVLKPPVPQNVAGG
mmetsp:Transcript_114673/g.180525  ORF Transcript_114673/g.180525 Transcript_114673/m.180525 type:complete len:682 (+) Transcript_114673:54-2099(+)|eukprot:CAMPEP_0169107906 /NCGR_PEP_ID=MMETSP1015-20121227/25142_1 /TAXON_ID=342587 /ORGANISM="Karlodinium micrum, Strain CCMP2283" /LENGTH=681 /DNA_ID=CAMNT_0009169489 /DNA_START=54 /DNA_END=2099 /DNA_ORIENTATION=+